MSKRYTKIIVLNDGQTFTDIDGCMVYEVPARWSSERIEEALMDDDDKIRLIHVFDQHSFDAKAAQHEAEPVE